MSMDWPKILIAMVVLSIVGISTGTYLTLSSVRSGRGPSQTGIAIQVGTIAIVLLSVVLVGLIAVPTSGLWAAAILLVPIFVVAILVLLGAVQGFKAGRRS